MTKIDDAFEAETQKLSLHLQNKVQSLKDMHKNIAACKFHEALLTLNSIMCYGNYRREGILFPWVYHGNPMDCIEIFRAWTLVEIMKRDAGGYDDIVLYEVLRMIDEAETRAYASIGGK